MKKSLLKLLIFPIILIWSSLAFAQFTFYPSSSSSQVNTSNITGIFGVGSGGTGLSTLGSGRIPFGMGTAPFGSSSSLIWNSSTNTLSAPYFVGDGSGLTNITAGSIGIQNISTTGNITEKFVLANAASNQITLSLPSAVSASVVPHYISKTDSSTHRVIIIPTLGQTISGASSFTIDSQYGLVALMPNGTNWVVLFY